MALRVSPEHVRDVRFAEQWRGYRTDEVDEFVEQVAEAFDEFEARLAEQAERTASAERRLEDRGPDEDLRRTLVLAQRTADAALEEAQVEAARLVADAEERARSILEHLEERRARIEGEIDARMQAELADVSDRRAGLEADVELLASYVENHRDRLIQELRTHLDWLERAGHLEAVPAPPPPTPAVAVPASEASRVFEQDDFERDDAELVVPKNVLPQDDDSDEVVSKASVPVVEAAPEDVVPGGAADDDTVDDRQEDDTVLDDLDVIPWSGVPGDQETADAGGVALRSDETDDDPFIAELRRAVDDPEPLGPREERDEWVEDVDLYQRHKAGPMRSRRRRRP